jgi:hypothetical protein
MKRLAVPALALTVLASPGLAQQPGEAMKPGPEHQRMGFFAGTWQFEGEVAESPMGPAGKVTGTDRCEWFAGGFQLVCQGDANTPRGAVKNGSIWGYDPMQQKYTYYGYNSMGEGFYVTGGVAGKVWTWIADFPSEGGGTMKLRATLTEESPAAYTYKVEMSPDGTRWMVAEEGRSTKRR